MAGKALAKYEKPKERTEKDYRAKFAETTREAAFNLNLGIREIRILAKYPWRPNGADWLEYHEVMAYQRLIDRGLIERDRVGAAPRLSQAGQLVRQLLVLSRHIVEPD